MVLCSLKIEGDKEGYTISMKKEKNTQSEKEQGLIKEDESIKKNQSEESMDTSKEQECSSNEEMEELKVKLDEKAKQCEEYFNMLQRTAAEFDNYKKRTAKEKEAIYTDATSDVVAAFLPVVDNIERAVQASANEGEGNPLREGVELVYRQFKEVMKKLGVEEIKCQGEKFDPNLHNAVMHVEDPEFGESVVVEEFQKGYILKDKVIRHSMVKVAN